MISMLLFYTSTSFGILMNFDGDLLPSVLYLLFYACFPSNVVTQALAKMFDMKKLFLFLELTLSLLPLRVTAMAFYP